MRIEAGLTQAQLAKRLKVSQGYVSRIEGRNYKVNDRLLARVKAALKRK
jgi:transcriptional regulator with XRE-family HTH domain